MLTCARSLSVILFFAGCAIAQQCPVMPAGLVCITQEAANKAGENARDAKAKDEKIAALEASVAARDQSIKELQETNTKNVADLTDRLHKTELDDATKTGQLINAEAEVQRLTAFVQFVMQNGRKKCSFSIICLP